MNTIQSKSLLTLIIIFFIIGFSTSAKNFIVSPSSYYKDTITNKSLDSASSLYLVDNPERVVYPEILEEHRDESEDYVERYSKREREYIIHMFKRGKNYFPKADAILTKYDVPQEFRVLPALESNFKSNAVSPVGAVGYWQFMGELAREYGLHTGGQNDERKNFTKSTVAAAKFFRDQLDFFNDDILMTVAAFNCGQGRVRSSIKKSKTKNPDYWDIKEFLPAETRRFVMKFVSLNVIAANYDKFLKRKLDFNQPHVIQVASLDSSQTDISVSRNAL